MQKIDAAEYRKRIDKLSEIYAGIAAHADEQATYRCPYKNRFDECTAKFGCRNQRKPGSQGGLLRCGGDDKLDYRSAWETEPGDPPTRGRKELGPGSIRHDGASRPLAVGQTVFDYADELAVQVPTSCGRTGHCHECIVEIKEGMEALNERTSAESFLQDNYRLACQARVDDAAIDVEFAPLRRTPKILSISQEKPLSPDPMVTRRDGTVYYGDEAVDSYRGHIYGLAVDLGTTTVVLNLVDLESGRTTHVSSFENPQRFGGSDVMHRISYDGKYPGELRQAIVKALNHEIMAMARRLEFTRQEIYEVVVAGNSTMRDIFFGLEVQSIGQRPYKSLVEHDYLEGRRSTTALVEKTRRLGVRANPAARVYGMPLIASHVGADTAADLVAIDMESQEEVVMLVDVGTNTEVVVGHRGRLLTASCPGRTRLRGRPDHLWHARLRGGHRIHPPARRTLRLPHHRRPRAPGHLRLRPHRPAGRTAPPRADDPHGRVLRQEVRTDHRSRAQHHLLARRRQQSRPGQGGQLLRPANRAAPLRGSTRMR